MDYKTNIIVDEARRILLEQPHLMQFEAINEAKKNLSPASKIGPKKNINQAKYSKLYGGCK